MAHPDSTHDQQKHVAPTTATVNAVGVDLASVLPQSDKPWFMQKHLLHLNGLLLFVIMTPASLGFDASMMNGLQALQTWQNSFGVPTGALLGLFNAVMPLGTVRQTLPLRSQEGTLIAASSDRGLNSSRYHFRPHRAQVHTHHRHVYLDSCRNHAVLCT